MPGPTNGDSSVTPSRSGIPGCAFSANSRYRPTVPSSTVRARQGVAKLPPTTILGVSGSPPSTIASCRSDRTRIAVSYLPLDGEPPPVHDRRGDPDEVITRPRRPRFWAGPLQTADLLAVGHRLRVPDDGHAPARMGGDIDAVRLEGHHRADGGGGELAAGVRSDDDVAVVHREVHEFHRGQCLPGVDDPAERHLSHQPQALSP